MEQLFNNASTEDLKKFSRSLGETEELTLEEQNERWEAIQQLSALPSRT